MVHKERIWTYWN